jgi:hypothetical protein
MEPIKDGVVRIWGAKGILVASIVLGLAAFWLVFGWKLSHDWLVACIAVLTTSLLPRLVLKSYYKLQPPESFAAFESRVRVGLGDGTQTMRLFAAGAAVTVLVGSLIGGAANSGAIGLPLERVEVRKSDAIDSPIAETSGYVVSITAIDTTIAAIDGTVSRVPNSRIRTRYLCPTQGGDRSGAQIILEALLGSNSRAPDGCPPLR